uniref:Reverse transcriptase domain-containing protein n=1 Tax=Knipowitschia caucasica TaxID=637954 RepID=A0AAV2LZF7_KNICA
MAGLHLKEVLVFIDDIIVFSATLEEHETRLMHIGRSVAKLHASNPELEERGLTGAEAATTPSVGKLLQTTSNSSCSSETRNTATHHTTFHIGAKSESANP